MCLHVEVVQIKATKKFNCEIIQPSGLMYYRDMQNINWVLIQSTRFLHSAYLVGFKCKQTKRLMQLTGLATSCCSATKSSLTWFHMAYPLSQAQMVGVTLTL